MKCLEQVQKQSRLYLQKYPKESWCHDQQQLVRYCLQLLGTIKKGEEEFELKFIVVLAEINKKMRQKHHSRLSTVLTIFLGHYLVDTGQYKKIIDDALCQLIKRTTYSQRISNSSSHCYSVKRGDIAQYFNISVHKQKEMIKEMKLIRDSKKGLLALTLYQTKKKDTLSLLARDKKNKQESFLFLVKDVLDVILTYIPEAMNIDQAEQVLNKVREDALEKKQVSRISLTN